MSAEAAALHEFGLPRHDSMYLFLPPCVYFLFCALLPFRGKRLDSLATVSLVIYVVHPMAIVAVRLAARALRLWGLLVENSLAHALAVCVVSMGVGTAAAFWKGLARRRRGKRHRAGT